MELKLAAIIMKRLVRAATKKDARRRGFTLVEIMISISILSLVMVAVASLQSISGRTIKDVYAMTRSRGVRMAALDQIRFTLANARMGTAVTSLPGANGGFYQIQYTDPTLGNVTSQFNFNPTTRILSYDDNINAAPAARTVVTGPIDINFTVIGTGALVQLRVKNAASVGFGSTDPQDGITTVELRNS